MSDDFNIEIITNKNPKSKLSKQKKISVYNKSTKKPKHSNKKNIKHIIIKPDVNADNVKSEPKLQTKSETKSQRKPIDTNIDIDINTNIDKRKKKSSQHKSKKKIKKKNKVSNNDVSSNINSSSNSSSNKKTQISKEKTSKKKISKQSKEKNQSPVIKVVKEILPKKKSPIKTAEYLLKKSIKSPKINKDIHNTSYTYNNYHNYHNKLQPSQKHYRSNNLNKLLERQNEINQQKINFLKKQQEAAKRKLVILQNKKKDPVTEYFENKRRTKSPPRKKIFINQSYNPLANKIPHNIQNNTNNSKTINDRSMKGQPNKNTKQLLERKRKLMNLKQSKKKDIFNKSNTISNLEFKKQTLKKQRLLELRKLKLKQNKIKKIKEIDREKKLLKEIENEKKLIENLQKQQKQLDILKHNISQELNNQQLINTSTTRECTTKDNISNDSTIKKIQYKNVKPINNYNKLNKSKNISNTDNTHTKSIDGICLETFKNIRDNKDYDDIFTEININDFSNIEDFRTDFDIDNWNEYHLDNDYNLISLDLNDSSSNSNSNSNFSILDNNIVQKIKSSKEIINKMKDILKRIDTKIKNIDDLNDNLITILYFTFIYDKNFIIK